MLRMFPNCGLAAASLLLATSLAHAADPASGTITDSSKTLTYAVPAQPVANASGPRGEYVCDATDPCDDFALSVQLPADYAVTHPQDRIRIDAAANVPAADIDMYLLDGAGNKIDESRHNPPTQESLTFTVVPGTSNYIVRIFPGSPHNGATVNITLFTDDTAQVPGGPQAVYGGIAPRYQNFFAPNGSAGNGSQGEFNIGFNPKTGAILTYAASNIFKLTPPEKRNPALPMACEADWQDVTPLIITAPAPVGDPILWTDQSLGRTFASNATIGATILFAYTDDDGASWRQASAAPPNGSADHETIGTGPYPAGSPLGAIAAASGFPNAVYYCAQGNIPATCQRSDDGGASFGPPNAMYDGVNSACSGIHGHVRVAPDGTVWVPVRGCGHGMGYAISKDAGITWSDAQVPDTTTGEWDPSIGLATDSTAYYCYAGADGHPHVKVSKDSGATWINDYDIGQSVGVQNAVFTEAIAGDPDRAACGFVGTDVPGNYGGLDFTGVWYLYIATTYDGGKSWVTVKVTPDDPVQGAGGVCVGGIGCSANPNNRNLLDFNEITLTDKGMVLFGYDDGCVGTCVENPAYGSYIAQMRVARQTGGRPLFAAAETAEPVKPGAACLDGFRSDQRAHLTWKAPDNGGSPISRYDVYRSTSADHFDGGPIGSTGGELAYDDRSADPKVADYFYKIVAVNGQGSSDASNVMKLEVGPEPLVENACAVPGISLGNFPSGDAQDMLGPHDILSMSMAEPSDMPGKLAFTMKVDGLSPLPPNTLWAMRFYTKTPPPNGDVSYFVGLSTEGGTAKFVHGTVGVVDAVATSVSVYTIAGEIDPASSYASDGTITMIADKSLFGPLDPGDVINVITGTVRVFTNSHGPIASGTQDQADAGGYRLRGSACGALAGTAAAAPSKGRFGGALGGALLVPLLALAGLRRRWSGA